MMQSADCASSQTLDPFQILSKIEILSKAYWKTFFFAVEPAMILWKDRGTNSFLTFYMPKERCITKWLKDFQMNTFLWHVKSLMEPQGVRWLKQIWRSSNIYTNFVLQRFDGNFFYQKCQCYFKLSLSVEVLFFS